MSELRSFRTAHLHSFRDTAKPAICISSSDCMSDAAKSLQRLQDDATLPNHVRKSVEETLKALQTQGETSIRASRARHILEEITDNETVEAYTRTQLLNIVSMLENV